MINNADTPVTIVKALVADNSLWQQHTELATR